MIKLIEITKVYGSMHMRNLLDVELCLQRAKTNAPLGDPDHRVRVWEVHHIDTQYLKKKDYDKFCKFDIGGLSN